MVQEAQPQGHVLLPFRLLYGYRDHIWIRLAAYQYPAILWTLQ
jgi:hypothetical protein